MRSRFLVLLALAGLIPLVATTPAQAGHHLWDVTEIFSDASGTVQFIELFTAEDNEQGVGPFTITASGNTFNFVTNLSTAATANTWILVATGNVASLPGGVTPDYILPANFFNTGGGTINYAGVDIWNYGAVPTDGVHSLARNGSTPVNSPTNFAGDAGEIELNANVPAVQTWGFVLLVGCVLLAASGLLRNRRASSVA
jgi:hypothetical protein